MRVELRKTGRTRVRQQPSRGVFDRPVIEAILDEGLVCHLAFIHDGHPIVIPTLYARAGDVVYIHGSTASRMLRTLARGCDISLAVTLLDGLVLARSAFHHSVNYRSVILFGRASRVDNPAEKLIALEAFSEHVVPGRWAAVRPPSTAELKATTVLSIPLEEASAKIRSGPPLDEEDDYARNIWAGVIPLRLVTSDPETDPRVPAGIDVPHYALHYTRGSLTTAAPGGESTPRHAAVNSATREG